MMKNINSLPYKVEVVSTKGLNKQVKVIRFRFVNKKEGKEFTFEPGQYILISVLGFGEAALTITTTATELPEFEIAVRSAGVTTQALQRLITGDIAYIRGPLGNSIPIQKAYGKELVLIAGGIGLAPLRSTIQTIQNDSQLYGSLKIVCGAKTPEDLIFKGELSKWGKFAEVHITVDKADSEWRGEVGQIPEILKKIQIDKGATVIVCGPPVMYESVVQGLLAKGVAEDHIELMLERRMRCGIGKCQHCTCGDKYVCLDGPTLSWDKLKNNWETFK